MVGKGEDENKGVPHGRGDNNNYPPPALAAEAASSELEPAIPFGLGGKEAAATSAGYDKLAFDVFSWGSILFFVHRCLYRQGCVDPGGSATVGLWQGREVA